MRILLGGLCALLLAVSMNGQPLHAAGSCEGLASLTLPNATITLARAVDAGTFSPAAPAGGAAPPGGARRPSMSRGRSAASRRR